MNRGPLHLRMVVCLPPRRCWIAAASWKVGSRPGQVGRVTLGIWEAVAVARTTSYDEISYYCREARFRIPYI